MKGRTKHKSLIMVSLLMGILLLLCSCGKQDTSEVHIGYFNNITHAQALYMKARGTLQERIGDKAQVTWTAFNAGPAEVESLFAGDIDIGYIGPVPAIMANSRSHGDVTVLSGSAQAGAVLVVAGDSQIASVNDLDGKIVAIPQIGNTQHLCLLKLLEDAGLSPVDQGGSVTVTAVENADVQNMMDQGNIDAALVPEPWGSMLEAAGAKVLLDYDAVYQGGDYPVTVVVVRNDYLKENPEVVEAFLEEHEACTKLMQEEADECAPIVNEEIGSATGKSLDENILLPSFGRIGFSTEINKDSMTEFGELALKQEFITEWNEDIYTDMK